MQDNFYDNQSLENVKDTTQNNSPTNVKHVNTDMHKKEIYIEDSFDQEYATQNETGIMRFSNVQ